MDYSVQTESVTPRSWVLLRNTSSGVLEEDGSLGITATAWRTHLETEPILTISYLTAISLTSSVGMVGNVLVIVSVCTYPKLRTKANVFIINLAIADCFIAYFTQGFNIVGVVIGYEFFASRMWLCALIAHVCLTTCSCSLWNMAAIAVNRCLVLCHPGLSKRYMTWKNTILAALFLWVPTLLVDLPNYLGWSRHAFDFKTMMCLYDRLYNYWYSVFFAGVLIFPPLITMVSCYIQIFVHVRQSRQLVEKMGAVKTGRGQGSTSKELRLAKTLLIMFAAFILLWGPYGALILIDVNDKADKIWHVFFIQMAHTNSSINCIIYAASNSDFRDAYKAILRRLCCCCPKHHNDNQGGNSNSTASISAQSRISAISADIVDVSNISMSTTK